MYGYALLASELVWGVRTAARINCTASQTNESLYYLVPRKGTLI